MGGVVIIEIHETKFNVAYEMSGFGDDAEIDEMTILVGETEISADCLDSKVLRKIDEACYEDYWKSIPEGPEHDDMGDR